MPEYRTGEHGSSVAVVKRPGRRNWYLRAWDPARNQPWYQSTGTTDFESAKRQARLLARQIEDGEARQSAGPTLRSIFRDYLELRTPEKRSKTSRTEDERRVLMWRSYLGDVQPGQIGESDWRRFMRDRGSGRIDGRGLPVEKPKSVRPRTVRADLSWLRTVFRWAVKTDRISSNPLERFDLPSDDNPRRPLANRDRFEATMSVAEGTLADILPVVVATGRRISSVLQLRWNDVDLDSSPATIRWRAKSDKQGRESVMPITPSLAAHFNRIRKARPGIRETPIFPSPSDPSKPVDRYRASRWLKKAEKKAGLKSLDGSLWHAYRRMWATERKHLPDTDVAYYGGWKSVVTLQRIYQQPDSETLLRVAGGNLELREKGNG